MERKYITICEASNILHVSTVTARKMAGKPDKVSRTKYNLPLFLYDREKILSLRDEQNKKVIVRQCEKCRICHRKLQKEELVGGRCKQCRADYCVINFCQGNCFTCPLSKDLISCLKKSLEKIEKGEIKCPCL